MNESVLDVVERFATMERMEGGHEILASALREMELSNLAYFAVNLPEAAPSKMLHAATYSAEWQKLYHQRSYVHIDPVVRLGLGGILPVDWSNINREDPLVRQFFGEAQEFDVGSKGLSLPIRGRYNEFALLSVTSSEDQAQWERRKAERLPKLMFLSYHFHDWCMNKLLPQDGENLLDRLTMREKDVLRFRARGRSIPDIGDALGVSDRTVNFHLTNAMEKLKASNIVHAVSKAQAMGLIVEM